MVQLAGDMACMYKWHSLSVIVCSFIRCSYDKEQKVQIFTFNAMRYGVDRDG